MHNTSEANTMKRKQSSHHQNQQHPLTIHNDPLHYFHPSTLALSATTTPSGAGITHRKSSLNTSSGGGGGTGAIMSNSPHASNKSPLPAPPITEFMMHDYDYKHHYSSPSKKKNKALSQNNNHHPSYPTNQIFYSVQYAKFCSYFSIIAILFLVMIGLLIEIQPLYIRGVSPQRTPMAFRQLQKENENVISYVHYSGRLRMIQRFYIDEIYHYEDDEVQQVGLEQLSDMNMDMDMNIDNGKMNVEIDVKEQNEQKEKQQEQQQRFTSSATNEHQNNISKNNNSKNKNNNSKNNNIKNNNKNSNSKNNNSKNDDGYLRTLSNTQKNYIIYEMKSEAKTAFKAAALYFVIFVLSVIYTHEHQWIHFYFLNTRVIFTFWSRLKYLLAKGFCYIKDYVFIWVYGRGRSRRGRKDYRNIPDKSTIGVGGGSVSGKKGGKSSSSVPNVGLGGGSISLTGTHVVSESGVSGSGSLSHQHYHHNTRTHNVSGSEIAATSRKVGPRKASSDIGSLVGKYDDTSNKGGGGGSVGVHFQQQQEQLSFSNENYFSPKKK